MYWAIRAAESAKRVCYLSFPQQSADASRKDEACVTVSDSLWLTSAFLTSFSVLTLLVA